jgi:ornithine carbamoyltransferase
MITKRKWNYKIVHCLPVRRNVVVEDAVLDSDSSLVVNKQIIELYCTIGFEEDFENL